MSYKLSLFFTLMVCFCFLPCAKAGVTDDWTGLLQSYRDDTRASRIFHCVVTDVSGGRVSGEIFLHDRLVITMILPAGGYPVARRAHLVTERLNRYFDEQAYYDKIKVEKWSEGWVVSLDGSLVVTAATGTSKHFRMSKRELANRWADQLRTAVHELIGPGAQVLRDNPPVEKLSVVLPPWDDRYYWIAKGDKAYNTGSYKIAEACYRKALKEDPSGFDARYKLGMTLWKQGSLEEARLEFVGTIQVRPYYHPARIALEQLDLEVRSSLD